MARALTPLPVKLICGVIFASEGVLIKARKNLERRFGPCDFQSSGMPFDFTDHYEQEMGSGLRRQFLSFQRLINPRRLPAIKLYTNRLEKRFARAGKRTIYGERSRTINLDPGYLCASRLVLASCKDYAHRIYLDKGVYAEITLHFEDGAFRPHPWTYPDYKSKGYLESFHAIRQVYMKQLSQQGFL